MGCASLSTFFPEQSNTLKGSLEKKPISLSKEHSDQDHRTQACAPTPAPLQSLNMTPVNSEVHWFHVRLKRGYQCSFL